MPTRQERVEVDQIMQCAAELLRDMGHERSSRMEQVEKERSRSFNICPCLPFLEGRAELVQFFPFVRHSSTGDVSFSTRSHIACVVNRKKSNSRHSHVISHFLSSTPTSFKNLLNNGVILAEHIETINLAGVSTPRSCFLRARKFCVRTRGT